MDTSEYNTLRRCRGECFSLVTSMVQRGFISAGQRPTGRVMKVVNEAWPWGASIVPTCIILAPHGNDK